MLQEWRMNERADSSEESSYEDSDDDGNVDEGSDDDHEYTKTRGDSDGSSSDEEGGSVF